MKKSRKKGGRYLSYYRTISSNGRISIPKSIRDAIGMSDGDMITLQIERDSIVLKNIRSLNRVKELISICLKEIYRIYQFSSILFDDAGEIIASFCNEQEKKMAANFVNTLMEKKCKYYIREQMKEIKKFPMKCVIDVAIPILENDEKLGLLILFGNWTDQVQKEKVELAELIANILSSYITEGAET